MGALTVKRSLFFVALILLLGFEMHASSPVQKSRDGSGKNGRAPSIVNVSTDTVAFDPTAKERVTVLFRLSLPAEVKMRIWDSSDRWIRTIDGGGRKAGENRIVWDGRDDSGALVPDEAYFYTLEASGAENDEPTIYDVTDRDRGSDFSIQDVALDRETGVVSYTIPGPSRVDVRITWGENGPMVRSVVNWEPRVGNLQKEEWDGWDVSRVVNFSEHPDWDLRINAIAFRLPRNAIVVQGGSKARGIPGQRSEIRRPRESDPQRMYQHYQHLREDCVDPPIRLQLAEAANYNALTLDAVTVQVTADPEIERFINNQRAELVFYVDGVFAHEEELGYLPFTWRWRPKGLSGTDHVIHVLVLAYEGHWAAAGLKVSLPDP